MGKLIPFLLLLTLTITTFFEPAVALPNPSSLTNRFVPVPAGTYTTAAKLSAKVIIIIIIFVLVTLILSTCTCYICIKRSRSRARARLVAKERSQSKQLKPRINNRNARFFAPGLAMDKIERDRLREMRKTEEAWKGTDEVYEMWKYNSGVHVEEMKRPEKAKNGWREVMRGVMGKK